MPWPESGAAVPADRPGLHGLEVYQGALSQRAPRQFIEIELDGFSPERSELADDHGDFIDSPGAILPGLCLDYFQDAFSDRVFVQNDSRVTGPDYRTGPPAFL